MSAVDTRITSVDVTSENRTGPAPLPSRAPVEGVAAGRLQSVRGRLPTGMSVSEESFQTRHRVVRWSLVLLIAILTATGLGTGTPLSHIFFELLPVTAGTLLAWRSASRSTATLSAAWALMASSSILVHQTEGLIEAHFLFFVLLPLVSLYQDWRAFLGSIGFVLLSHGLVGTVAPESMYNHAAAVDNPVLWALIHAVFVAALVIVLIIEWNFAELDQHRTELALEDLQSAQAQLFQAQKLESVGQLAAGVAHEINTPVQYVSDNTAFLRDSFADFVAAFGHMADLARETDDEAVTAYLRDADIDFLIAEFPQALDQSKDGLDRVAEIVRAMKDFSHPGRELGDADLNQAVVSTTTVSRSEWKYVAELELDLDQTMPLVCCNEGQIKQVILNLIVNAAHAISDATTDSRQGLITARTRRLNETITIEIIDNGCGMTPDIQTRVFDQFFTTKDVGRGTGLGLAMAHEIITSQGGSIRVSSAVGIGTTFTIELPINAQPTSGEPTTGLES